MRLGGSERLDRVTIQTTIAKTVANAEHDGGERTPEEGASKTAREQPYNKVRSITLSIATRQL
jgi:hypothetical protein